MGSRRSQYLPGFSQPLRGSCDKREFSFTVGEKKMKKEMKKVGVIIIVKGGMVQSVFSDNPDLLRVRILDRDNDDQKCCQLDNEIKTKKFIEVMDCEYI